MKFSSPCSVRRSSIPSLVKFNVAFEETGGSSGFAVQTPDNSVLWLSMHPYSNSKAFAALWVETKSEKARRGEPRSTVSNGEKPRT